MATNLRVAPGRIRTRSTVPFWLPLLSIQTNSAVATNVHTCRLTCGDAHRGMVATALRRLF